MKTLLAVVLALALLASACASGSDDSDDELAATPDQAEPGAADTEEPDDTVDEPTAESTPAATADATEPAEATEPAGSAEPVADFDAGVDTIEIGVLQPFSGPIGFLGQFIRNSVQVEIDRINEAGGLGGAQLEIIERDTELNPQLAVQGAQELAGDADVGVIIGPAFTGFFNATKQIFEDAQMPNCQMAVAAASALDDTTFAFRAQDPDQFRVPAMLDYLSEQDVTTVGLVYENDDTGQGYADTLPDLTAERGMEFVGFEATRPDDQSHRAQVEAVASADAILVSNNSTAAAKTAAAAQEIGYEGQLFGFSGLQGFTYVEGAGEAAEGTVFVSNYLGYFTTVPEDEWPPAYRDHVNAVIDEYGETAGPQSGVEQYNGTALAADCVVMYERAVQAAGSIEGPAVRDAWETLDIPAEEMPSFVQAQFGPDDHETYGENAFYVYEWTQTDDGTWILEELQAP